MMTAIVNGGSKYSQMKFDSAVMQQTHLLQQP
jgi:hypothetical protein